MRSRHPMFPLTLDAVKPPDLVPIMHTYICAACRLYWALTTFLAMLLPYFGDFVPLAGSLSVFPIIFSATLVMTAMVRFPNGSDSDVELVAKPPHCTSLAGPTWQAKLINVQRLYLITP